MTSTPTRSLGRLAVVLTLVAGPQVGAQQRASQQLVAIRNINVIDVRAGRVIPAQTVLVRDGRITAVDRGPDVRIPSDARIIEGAGKYLLPGLWDMHAHLSNKAAWEVDMPQYLAHGVTGVRVMQTWMECPPPIAGDACFDQLKEWQQRVLAGEWRARAFSLFRATC